MNLDQLGINRFLTKGNQVLDVEGAAAMALNSSPNTGGNFYDSQNFDTKDARQIQTGTVISNCFIRTTDLPARIELSGNDMRVFDDSTGGTSPVEGDTASINFIRSDDTSKFFTIEKRTSIVDDLGNVMNFFYSPPATGDHYNTVFFGRTGDKTTVDTAQRNTSGIFFAVNYESSEPADILNGVWYVEVSEDSVNPEQISIVTGDSRIVSPAPVSANTGYSTWISAGDGGAVSMAYKFSPTQQNHMWYIQDPTRIRMGASIVPDAGTYDIGLIAGTINRVQNIYFNGQVAGPDVQCLTLAAITSVNCGTFTNTVKSTFNGSVVACPLPTVSEALPIIRRIPEPTKVGNRGHYGDKLYFDDLTFPEEVLWEIEGVKEIEHTHMIGLLMKAVVELTNEVDLLKAQLNK